MSRTIRFTALVLALFAMLPVAASALCVEVGKPVPNVTLPTIDGKNVTLSSFRGKIVLLAFWASWCPRCVEELTFLQGIYKMSPDIVVLAINQESQNISHAHIERIRKTLKESKIDFPVLIDRNLDAWNTFCINALPTSIIVDPKGKVRFAEPNYYWATQDKIADIIGVIRKEKD
ncbi:MAG TPA: TlpA disulfide reductase family protein [Candidatus Methylomirabilis sp.]|nr:TlpA disulfide reductase family protein [Candidatus Methylomirabilis sp.]